MSDSPFDDNDLADTNDADLFDAPTGKQQTTETTQAAPAVVTEDDDEVDDVFGGGNGADDHHAAASTPVPEAKQDDFFGGSSDENADQGFGEEVHPEASLDAVTPLSLWEAERKKVLEGRKQAAKDSKDRQLKTASAEIDTFYQQRAETYKKTQQHNRSEEQNTKKDLEALFAHGTPWEKVARLLNLQPKANEDRKVGRLRKLLIHLKNDRSGKAAVPDADD